MSGVFFEWVWSGFFATVTGYIFAMEFKAIVKLLTNTIISLKTSFFFGCAFLTIGLWDIYQYTNLSLKSILEALYGIIWTGSILGIFFRWISSGQSLTYFFSLLRFPRSIVEFYLFFIFLCFLNLFFIGGVEFPVMISPNNDIWSYSKYAKFILNKNSGNNIVGFDLFKSGTANQTPLAMIYLASLSALTGHSIFKILSPAILLIMAGSVIFIKDLSRKFLQLNSWILFFVPLIWVTSLFSVYMASRYFLAQWMGIFLFLATLFIVVSEKNKIALHLFIIPLMSYLIIMTYPYMFIPYLGIFVYASVLYSFLNGKTEQSRFKINAIVPLFTVPFAILIAYLFDPIQFMGTIKLINVLANGVVGWPLSLINPFIFILLPYPFQIDSGPLWMKLIGFILLTLVIGLLTIRNRARKKLSPAAFTATFLFFSVLLVYLVYFAFKGSSYQQWKFAGSVVWPLSFVPFILLFSAIELKKVFWKQFIKLILIIIFIVNIVIVYRYSDHSYAILARFSALRTLLKYDKDPLIDSITFDLKSHFQSTMIAAQFINHKPLTLWSASYYGGDKIERLRNISPQGLFITNNCSLFDQSHIIQQGFLYCIYRGTPSITNNYLVKFNKPLPQNLVAKGLSGAEDKGRWSQGNKIVLRIPVRKTWKGIEIFIKGDPFLTKDRTYQRIIFSVHDIVLKKVSLTSESVIIFYVDHHYFDGRVLPLDIRLPDSTSPSQYGSTDRRTMGFYFRTLQVKGIQQKNINRNSK